MEAARVIQVVYDNVSDEGRKLTQMWQRYLVALFHRIYIRSCINRSGMMKKEVNTVLWWNKSYAWDPRDWIVIICKVFQGCHEFKIKHEPSRWFKLFLLCRMSSEALFKLRTVDCRIGVQAIQFRPWLPQNLCKLANMWCMFSFGRLHVLECSWSIDISQHCSDFRPPPILIPLLEFEPWVR